MTTMNQSNQQFTYLESYALLSKCIVDDVADAYLRLLQRMTAITIAIITTTSATTATTPEITYVSIPSPWPESDRSRLTTECSLVTEPSAVGLVIFRALDGYSISNLKVVKCR